MLSFKFKYISSLIIESRFLDYSDELTIEIPNSLCINFNITVLPGNWDYLVEKKTNGLHSCLKYIIPF